MLVKIIFSLFKVTQEIVNPLFMQVQRASSLTDGTLPFYSGINYQKSVVTYFQELKLPKHLKLNSHFKTSLKNLRKVPTKNYIAICTAARFLATNAFLLKVIEIRPNTKKAMHQF